MECGSYARLFCDMICGRNSEMIIFAGTCKESHHVIVADIESNKINSFLRAVIAADGVNDARSFRVIESHLSGALHWQ